MHVTDVPCFWKITEYLKGPRLGPSYSKMFPMMLGTVTKGIGRERNLVSTMICSAIKIIFDYHHGNLVGPRSPLVVLLMSLIFEVVEKLISGLLVTISRFS